MHLSVLRYLLQLPQQRRPLLRLRCGAVAAGRQQIAVLHDDKGAALLHIEAGEDTGHILPPLRQHTGRLAEIAEENAPLIPAADGAYIIGHAADDDSFRKDLGTVVHHVLQLFAVQKGLPHGKAGGAGQTQQVRLQCLVQHDHSGQMHIPYVLSDVCLIAQRGFPPQIPAQLLHIVAQAEQALGTIRRQDLVVVDALGTQCLHGGIDHLPGLVPLLLAAQKQHPGQQHHAQQNHASGTEHRLFANFFHHPVPSSASSSSSYRARMARMVPSCRISSSTACSLSRSAGSLSRSKATPSSDTSSGSSRKR